MDILLVADSIASGSSVFLCNTVFRRQHTWRDIGLYLQLITKVGRVSLSFVICSRWQRWYVTTNRNFTRLKSLNTIINGRKQVWSAMHVLSPADGKIKSTKNMQQMMQIFIVISFYHLSLFFCYPWGDQMLFSLSNKITNGMSSNVNILKARWKCHMSIYSCTVMPPSWIHFMLLFHRKSWMLFNVVHGKQFYISRIWV